MILGEVAFNEISFRGEVTEDLLNREFVDGLRTCLSQSYQLALINTDALFMPTRLGMSCFDAVIQQLGRDEKEQLLLLLGRCPSGWSSPDTWPGRSSVEVNIDGLPSSGAAMAVARRSGLAGLGVTTPLRSPVLSVEVYELNSATDEVIERSVDLQHWYDATTALDFHDRRVAELQSSVRDAEELWECRFDMFPNLRFLRRCRDQLSEVETVALKQVIDRLVELDDSAQSWPPGSPAPSWASRITPEYEGRENLCYFSDDSGTSRLYEMHARYTPGAGRIHFRLLHQERMLEIAYIGSKLGA